MKQQMKTLCYRKAFLSFIVISLPFLSFKRDDRKTTIKRRSEKLCVIV